MCHRGAQRCDAAGSCLFTICPILASGGGGFEKEFFYNNDVSGQDYEEDAWSSC